MKLQQFWDTTLKVLTLLPSLWNHKPIVISHDELHYFSIIESISFLQ